jgi:Putative prokaryotic signal transducing protein
MDELVVIGVVTTEPEVELLCGLLRSAGIACLHSTHNRGAGASDGVPLGGPQEVMVSREQAESAREILHNQ